MRPLFGKKRKERKKMFVRFERHLIPVEKVLCACIHTEKNGSYITVDLMGEKWVASERKPIEETEKIFQKLLDDLNNK
jgi:hypothetical protein